MGEWVRIDEKFGQIVGISWRYTSIATTAGETIIVPNSYMIKNRITVIARRGERAVAWRRAVHFNVDYSYAPALVMQSVNTALAASEMENVASDPRPVCLLADFDRSAGRYAVRFWLIDPSQDETTDSNVRTHIFAALARAEIRLSIPEQSVHLVQQDERRATLRREREIERDGSGRERPPASRGVRHRRDVPHPAAR